LEFRRVLFRSYRVPRPQRRVQEDRGPDERSGHRRAAVSRPAHPDYGDAGQAGRVMHGRWASGWSADSGVALIEVVLVAVLVLSVAALAMPLTAHAADVSRVHAAAGFLSGRLRAARLHAVTRSAAVALVFDRNDAGWAFRVCSDGNGNGLRRADIAADRDRCE